MQGLWVKWQERWNLALLARQLNFSASKVPNCNLLSEKSQIVIFRPEKSQIIIFRPEKFKNAIFQPEKLSVLKVPKCGFPSRKVPYCHFSAKNNFEKAVRRNSQAKTAQKDAKNSKKREKIAVPEQRPTNHDQKCFQPKNDFKKVTSQNQLIIYFHPD